LRSLKDNVKKGCYFEQQLTGEESLYHIMNFVNGQQQIVSAVGKKAYLTELKRTNADSDCLKK
jgi:hypothetical protein